MNAARTHTQTVRKPDSFSKQRLRGLLSIDPPLRRRAVTARADRAHPVALDHADRHRAA
jgi:hypothetical protein